jgi:hypothetical protein
MSELHRNSPAEGEQERLGFVHENLEGSIPSVSTEAEIREALEKAFDYRGDLTLTLKSGQKLEGYLFDRKIKGPSLSECFVRLLLKDGGEKVSVAYSDVAALAFTGRDTAAGKSFAAWVKKYNEKKAAGETHIGIEAESLE